MCLSPLRATQEALPHRLWALPSASLAWPPLEFVASEPAKGEEGGGRVFFSIFTLPLLSLVLLEAVDGEFRYGPFTGKPCSPLDGFVHVHT